MKFKKGDKVIVIAGKAKGATGAVARVLPRENLVVIDGVNLAKRHRRATSRNRKGQIVEKAMPIHASNVQLLDPETGKPTRVGIRRNENGKPTRVALKSGKELD